MIRARCNDVSLSVSGASWEVNVRSPSWSGFQFVVGSEGVSLIKESVVVRFTQAARSKQTIEALQTSKSGLCRVVFSILDAFSRSAREPVRRHGLCCLIAAMLAAPSVAVAQSERSAPSGSTARIVVRLPKIDTSPGGGLLVRPNVDVVGGGNVAPVPPQPPGTADPISSDESPFAGLDEVVPMSGPPAAPPAEPLFAPSPLVMADDVPPVVQLEPIPAATPYGGVASPVFQEIVQQGDGGSIIVGPADMPCPTCGPHGDCKRCDPCCEPWYRLFDFGLHRTSCDPGIGHERVMLAPFFLDVTQPFNNVRVQLASTYGFKTPNRSEYLWAAPPNGPEPPEVELDYLDFRIMNELAPGDSFSIQTEIPLRSLDPVVNPNTTGLGDMNVATKLKMVDGQYWQITQLFRTHINTGSPRKGLGTGHVSLEPGVLARYEWNERLYFHGDLRFWIPIAGDPQFSGPAIQYGIGASYLAYDTDTFAVMPTLELIGWNFLDGLKTLPNGAVVPVDGDSTFAILPGVRFVLGPAGDLGLFEAGIAGGAGFDDSRDGWFDSRFLFELRWSY